VRGLWAAGAQAAQIQNLDPRTLAGPEESANEYDPRLIHKEVPLFNS